MKPNILFLVIDSLRADKLYGNKKRSITASIDSLIDEGVYFKQAINAVASTNAAVATIFTGLYPFNIGLSGGAYQKLDPKITTYIKTLKDSGYHAYSTSPEISSLFGITCDFENNDKTYQNYLGLFAGLGQQIIKRLEPGGMQYPWFFYVHLLDLHKPIIVPEEFDKESYGKTQYERMISAIDFWIGKVLEKIDIKNTLIVLTADHGDYIPVIEENDTSINFEPSKVEKNLWKMGNRIPQSMYPLKRRTSSFIHNLRSKIKSSKIKSENLTPYQRRILTSTRMDPSHHVYDDVIRIPLLFSGYSISSSKLIDLQVRHVDIFPTIAEIIGLEKKENIDGRSLVPLIKGEILEELPAYIESAPTLKKKSDNFVGIRTSQYKYWRSSNNSQELVELYDLANDPQEEHNIANEQKGIVKELEKTLRKIMNKYPAQIEHQELSDEEKKKIEDELRKLGYV